MNTSIKKLDDGRQTESMTSLFLSQSYQDAWDDYARSLKKEGFARWDYIVLTASNEEQAEGFHSKRFDRTVSALLACSYFVGLFKFPLSLCVSFD